VDAVAEVLQAFPLDIVEKCVDPIRGIARTKLDGEPRRFPPAVPEIIAFCESTVRDDYRPAAPAPEPPKPPPNADEKARVEALINGMRARRNREDQEYRRELHARIEARHKETEQRRLEAVRRRVSEDERAQAEYALERRRREAEIAASAARREASPFDDPDWRGEDLGEF